MAIFAPKCDRCGQRTRNKEQGRPMCEGCLQQMQLMLDAADEEVRPCPVDGSPMKKEIAHMIVIDKCSTCKGVWLGCALGDVWLGCALGDVGGSDPASCAPGGQGS